MPVLLSAMLLFQATNDPLPLVEVSPPYGEPFACSEHPDGQLKMAGDALGTDCMIIGGVEGDNGYSRPFRSDGKTNEDWYGWNAPVLAPFDGIVARVMANDVVNTPGTLGRPPAAFILFERQDGLRVLYAHVQQVAVRPGDRVKAGQLVARVGNNGYGRNPHIHIGAFKGEQPYQIRFDLRAMARLQRGGK